jgi:hypothetical protein
VIRGGGERREEDDDGDCGSSRRGDHLLVGSHGGE